MSRRRRGQKLKAEINVVPYIDVMLVLLIIFMVTSPMLSLTQGVEVDLPQVAAETVAESDVTPVVVTVDVQGQFYLTYDTHTDEPVTLDALGPLVVALLRQAPERAVLVRGDAAVSHGKVVELMGTLQGVGVRKVGVMTRTPEGAAK